MTHTNFAIRTYGKSEFALLMFPTIDDPKVAEGFRGYGGAGVRWYENSIRAEDPQQSNLAPSASGEAVPRATAPPSNLTTAPPNTPPPILYIKDGS